MNNKEKVLNAIQEQGMLPLFYHDSAQVSLGIILSLYKAGVRVLEYTNRGAEALNNFKFLKQSIVGFSGLQLGIGTVKTVAEAEAFVAAGADFIVSPIVNPDVAAVGEKAGILWIPGCMTPTEISIAQQHHAALIKVFPANILGPEFIASIRDLFAGQLFIPTGGVELNQQNISTWFKAGVCAVGMGSKLITKQILENELYEQLEEDTLTALALVAASRL